MKITFGGNPVNLIGEEVKVGEKAKDFVAVNEDLSEFNLKDHFGKVIVLSAAPSLDTSVCAFQAKRFNEEASKLSEDVQIINITVDLPFAQKRFCEANNIGNTLTVSDYKDRDFGEKYGFMIDEFKLLARGIVVIDKEGIIQHVEYVPEVTNEVDFDRALEAVKKLI